MIALILRIVFIILVAGMILGGFLIAWLSAPVGCP